MQHCLTEMLELAPGALIWLSKARGGANSKEAPIRRGRLFEGGRLFRLSIFSLKMTLSLFLFKTKLHHKNSKTL